MFHDQNALARLYLQVSGVPFEIVVQSFSPLPLLLLLFGLRLGLGFGLFSRRRSYSSNGWWCER